MSESIAPFECFQPEPELLNQLSLTTSTPIPTTGSRVWCHALKLGAGEVGHSFLSHDTTTPAVHMDALIVVLRMGGTFSSIAASEPPRSFSEICVYPRGMVPQMHYSGGTHEFTLLHPRHVEGGADCLYLTVVLVEPVWRLILALRGNLAPSQCEKAFDRVVTLARRFTTRQLSGGVQSAVRYIESNWLNGIRSSDVAEATGVSTSHLCRTFFSTFGLSIGEYIRLLRLNRAAGLLWGTKMGVGDVAIACGFYDQPHLCRELARYVSAPPSTFRSLAPCLGNVRLNQVKALIDPAAMSVGAKTDRHL